MKKVLCILFLFATMLLLVSCKNTTETSNEISSDASLEVSDDSPLNMLERFKNVKFIDMENEHGKTKQTITITLEEVGRKTTYTIDATLLNENYKKLDVRKRKMTLNVTGPGVSETKTIVFVDDLIFVDSDGDKYFATGDLEMFDQYTGFNEMLIDKEEYIKNISSVELKNETDEYYEVLLEEKEAEGEDALSFFAMLGMTDVEILSEENEYIGRVENDGLKSLTFNSNMKAVIDGVEKTAIVNAVIEMDQIDPYTIVAPKKVEYDQYPTIYANEIFVSLVNNFIMSGFKSFTYTESFSHSSSDSDLGYIGKYKGVSEKVTMICPDGTLKFLVEDITGEFTKKPILEYNGKTLTTYTDDGAYAEDLSQQEAALMMNNYASIVSGVTQLSEFTGVRYERGRLNYYFRIEESLAKALIESAMQQYIPENEYGEIEINEYRTILVGGLEQLGEVEYRIGYSYKYEEFTYYGEYRININKIEFLDQNITDFDV